VAPEYKLAYKKIATCLIASKASTLAAALPPPRLFSRLLSLIATPLWHRTASLLRLTSGQKALTEKIRLLIISRPLCSEVGNHGIEQREARQCHT
jgi:hypothetical protein